MTLYSAYVVHNGIASPPWSGRSENEDGVIRAMKHHGRPLLGGYVGGEFPEWTTLHITWYMEKDLLDWEQVIKNPSMSQGERQ